MPGFGPWTTYTALRQSDAVAPDWLRALYASPTSPGWRSRLWTYTLSQSFASYASGFEPHNYPDARVCALTHARELDRSFGGGWDPGACPAIGPPGDSETEGVSGGAQMAIGTVTGWRAPFPLVAGTFSCTMSQALGYLTYSEFATPGNVPAEVVYQVPGFADAVDAGQIPEVEVLRVDGEAWLACTVPQTSLSTSDTVTAHPTTTFGVPYSALGPSVMSVAATPGSVSSRVTIPDMQIGDGASFVMASARVAAAADPGDAQSNIALIDWATDFIYTIRVRMVSDVLNVCRWRQRDDGLGISGAARARTGTSLQSTSRFRGYR